MPEQPPDSAPVDQLGKNRPSDAQHGVAAKPSLLWPLLTPDPNYRVYGNPLTVAVLLRYHFLDGTLDQCRAVKSTIETSEKPLEAPSFVTWEDCANVKFQEVQANTPAEIRITFKEQVKKNGVVDDWYWSAIGSSSMDREQFPSSMASIRLAGLPNEYPPSDYHRGNILHEFGHALGLKHEHQSPAFKGVVNLNQEAILKHYHGNHDDAGRNVLDEVEEPTNYTRFDKYSIMVYTIDPEWQNTRWWQTSKVILANDKLSELDQAFIRLMYPPDLSISKNREPFREAMVTAGVDRHTAGLILSECVENQGSVGDRLMAIRNRFNIWKDGLLLFKKPNKHFWSGIDPAALRQSGVSGFIGEVTQNKLFQGIVRNIVQRTREQYGLPTNVSLPGGVQNEAMNMLGALAMHGDVARMVRYYDNQLNGKCDLVLSSDACPDSEIQTGQGTVKLSVSTGEPSDSTRENPDAQGTPQGTVNFPVGTGESSDSTHENPNARVMAPVDPDVWLKTRYGSGVRRCTFARLSKPRGKKTITITIRYFPMRVLLDLNKESFGVNINFGDIDLGGDFHYTGRKHPSSIITGEKAKWSPERITFYNGEWKLENITACYVVTSGRLVTKLALPDRSAANEDAENVRWEKY